MGHLTRRMIFAAIPIGAVTMALLAAEAYAQRGPGGRLEAAVRAPVAAVGQPARAPQRVATGVRDQAVDQTSDQAPDQAMATPAPIRQEAAEGGNGAPQRTSGFSSYGRPAQGHPEYGDEDFGRNDRRDRSQTNDAPRNGGRQAGKETGEEIEVVEGFFFDNYTSGSGFGVYGGEAVTSGSGTQLGLRSAGVTARELGILGDTAAAVAAAAASEAAQEEAEPARRQRRRR